MTIYHHTIEHLEVPDVQNITQSVMSIVQEVRNKMSLVSDIIKPGIQGIFYTTGGALFTYAYRFFTQQKSYEDGYMKGQIDGYNKGYREGFNQGYNEGFNQVALIAGAACVGAAVGTAATMCYAQHKQQNTQMTDAQVCEIRSLPSRAM
ncbi:hypothetical protein [Wolbachia endosymbiont of Ctenocephalides felis wCfeJ]|uniref:hypothetical protein n=1 Tax=Wolbachia endosymbiont of Ctenocephalides felis wCfeJ TaxID=2732594 RepID=UPI001FE71659|nr:hypothetical protein [Wolbachia endosymbiont of Ctenocephalides felis wCfeJ]WCR58485.1 MAG: hypothetical protein PG980_000957 [Wolbachia endosymbiont of Ctenocephalides felis wCfeJ]